MKLSLAARCAAIAAAAIGAGLATLASAAAPAPDSGWNELQRSGAVVLLRHAEAPGVGDPPQFKLGDCSSQRNLSAEGRAQAARIGDAFRTRNVAVGRVLHSEWCRTADTARLAFAQKAGERAATEMPPWPAAVPLAPEPLFNSFFGQPDAAPAQTAGARKLLLDWKGPGALVVVTHQVNITALTGVVPASGEAVVLRRRGDAMQEVGRIAP